ncbi:hypothetical protein [Sphingomonas bacterium]|uniref:hypothetical protein n=1 Tax=Sphingomonas bacterium TaxID=1895847 RepID=UPI0015753F08|nr:hypothetical protein [Sphingomonas bacterium]
MKTFSKLAFAFALTGSAGALVAMPAVAKDKKEEAKPGLKLSPDIIKAAQAAQTALAAKDVATATPLVAQVEAGAKTPDDKYLAANFRLNLEQLKLQAASAANPNAPQDNTPLIAPLDTLIASPNVPPEARGQLLYQRGAIAYNARQFAQASQFFAQAKAAGYANENLDMLIVKAKMDGGDTTGGVADLNGVIDKATAAGQKAPEEYYRYALSKELAAKDNAGSFGLMRKYLTAYPTAKNWRDMIVIYGLQNGSIATLDNGQKLDLFRLMRSTKSLADQVDYGDYAQKAYDRGLPAETLTVLSEGAATGKMPATNSASKLLRSTATEALKNQGSLAGLAAKAQASPNGKLAQQTADAYLGADDNAKAADLYRAALQKGGVDADVVNLRLGIALARSGDKAGAKTAFASVNGAEMGVAQLWTVYVDAPPTA